MDIFDFWQLFLRFRYPLLILFSGLILTLFGVLVYKSGVLGGPTKIEVLESATEGQVKGEITAEVSGAILKPGVYKMAVNSRVEDLLILSGGFSVDADRIWTDKYLNRAAKLTDGQKIYIPTDEQSKGLSAKTNDGDQTISPEILSDSNALININTAGLNKLDTLPGIGQVYGQNIIEHRPYSNIEELVSKGVIRQSLFEKVKNLITVY